MRCLGNNIGITVNDITVSYNDNGPDDAPVIIFIHGFPLNKSMWDKQAAALKNNYRVIAYDIRGHGNSEAGDEDFSIDLFVNDLISLMDKLKLFEVMLCGLSMGGYIALKAIEKFPKRFDSLVLSDTQCIADTLEDKQKRLKAIENIKENGVEQYADLSIKNLFAPGSFTTRVEEIAAVRNMIINTSVQSLCKTLIALAVRRETCSNLYKIEVPVLIMAGQEDKITPPDAARLIRENIQFSRIRILEHAGHIANMENPDEFNDQLIGFLHSHIKKAVSISY